MLHILKELEFQLHCLKSGTIEDEDFINAVDEIHSHYKKEYDL